MNGTKRKLATWAAAVLTVIGLAFAGAGAARASDWGDVAHPAAVSVAHPAPSSSVKPATLYYSGLCLDDPNDSTTNGTQQQVWGCHNVNQEWWQRVDVGVAPFYEIRTINGKCLDAYNGGGSNGAKVQIWTCLADTSQLWEEESNSDGTISWLNAGGNCLDLTNDNLTDGTKWQVWSCNGDNSQKSYWSAQGGAYYQLSPNGGGGTPAVQKADASPVIKRNTFQAPAVKSSYRPAS